MAAVKNILLSSTRNWNCGDDFIAFGVKRLLRAFYPDANFILYNRHPDLHNQRVHLPEVTLVHPGGRQVVDLRSYISQSNWRYDNSWHPRLGLEHIDLVVFAGTPEWFGVMTQPLVDAVLKSSVPVIYLGLGDFEGREQLQLKLLSSADQALLKRADLVCARDQGTQRLLAALGCLYLPCPALFAAPEFKASAACRPQDSQRPLKLAFSTQPDNSLQPMRSPGSYQYSLSLLEALGETFQCEILCHYVDELSLLAHLGLPMRYSYEAAEYMDLMASYDGLITTRVHGAGLAASLGVPAWVIAHSARSSTVAGFQSSVIAMQQNPQLIPREIQDFNFDQHKRRLANHRQQTWQAYIDLLAPILGEMPRISQGAN